MFSSLFKIIFGVLVANTALISAAPLPEALPSTPKEALNALMKGNERYTKDALLHPNRSQARRETLTDTQNPFATVLACSDSRVSPVIVFDQGIGDLFEVRNAGNVAGPVVLASLEYSVKHLGSSLIFVLGHENCGAVTAVLKGQYADIQPIADKIKEALKGLPKTENSLENAIKANIRNVVQEVKANPAIAKLISDKKVEVVGGYYHLESGKVEICCDLPENVNQTQSKPEPLISSTP